ncbi:TPA: hypothetical protein DEB00_01120 [Candidatus Uhrbacteria bacterium]|nr:hypothetical protein [Candidatus Uhrbacteria bacterium]
MKRVMMVIVMVLCACNFGPSETDVAGDVGGSPAMVDGRPTVHMPFPTGTAWRCTQGANGSWSHQYNSTRYDVDLDTPNPPTAGTVMYAPVDGVAYVHNDGNGFGLHVNVDHGDGTYSVLGHMSETLVESDSWVEAGQPLGLDGCTGSCTGDHVHLGVHSGNATRPAGQGSSIPFNLFAVDSNVGTTPSAHNTGTMVCGLTQGHFYVSQLPTWTDSPEDASDPTPPVEDPTPNNTADDDSDDPDPSEEDPTPADDPAEDPDPATGHIELCWQPSGLINPHDGELWVWDGGWQTVQAAAGGFVQLCGTVTTDPGDVLLINGEFEAANVLSNPWWICSNWGTAGGMVVHGTFFVNGISLPATSVDNGVNGCNARLTVP